MNLIGKSNEIKKVQEEIKVAAKSPASVLIFGETGTGKEVIATAIHQQSKLRGKFIRVNCAAIQDTLLESELFGHEKGAFTGAHARKIGKFQLADRGTLFLDEVTNMSKAIQAKILRVVEYQKFEPVGGIEQLSVNVRLVSATNRNIIQEVTADNFRKDLYYRLGVLIIIVPPLRDRIVDIPDFVSHFAAEFNEKYGKDIDSISTEAMNVLQNYDWPGNVRELKNVIERAFLYTDKTKIEKSDLQLMQSLTPKQIPTSKVNDKTQGGSVNVLQNAVDYISTNGYKGRLLEAIDDFEYLWMASELDKAEGVQKDAASNLGISPRVLCYKMTKHRKRLGKEKEDGF